MGDAVAAACHLLLPVARRIRERVFAHEIVSTDDTGLRVVDPQHANREHGVAGLARERSFPLRVTRDAYDRAVEKAIRGGGRIEKDELSTTVAAQAALVQGNSLFLPRGEPVARLIAQDRDAEAALIDAVETLTVDESGGAPRLYKPAALLCVLDGIDAGELKANQVPYDWLEPRLIAALKQRGIEASPQQAEH